MFGRVSKSMFDCAEDSFPPVTTERTIERSCHVSPVCIDQHFILVWLDENMNAIGSINYCKMVVHLQGIANAMCTFNNADQCIDFLTNIVDKKVVLVISDTYGQAIVPLVHDMPQISSIYVFYENSFKYEQCVKVKGVFTHISSSCDAFKRSVPSCKSCSASISVSLTTNRIYYQTMDHINQSFIYYYKLLQILCHSSLPTRLHFSDCFLSSIYHQYTMEISIFLITGFFSQMAGPHKNGLHIKQYRNCQKSRSTVFDRYQNLSTTESNSLVKTKDELMSFNNFLLTSIGRHDKVIFVGCSLVIFYVIVMNSLRSYSFCNIIEDINYCQDSKDQTVFSIHSIIQFGQIKQINGTTWLW